MSTLESFVFQSEEYHPVAQINLHKGLKCKIKIITSVRPQSTVLFSAIQLAGSLFPQLLCKGNKAWLSGSQQDPYEFLPGVMIEINR